MSREIPIPRQDTRPDNHEGTSEGIPVLAHGMADDDEPPRRGRGAQLVARISQDRRLGPVIAGLGAVAVLGSLVGEWTITTLPSAEPDGIGSVTVPAGVGEVGNLGIAYLAGVFGVAGCLALVLFGFSVPVRHNARVVGLVTVGGLLAVLAAATYSLDDAAERRAFFPTDEGFQIAYGRGLTMAFIGVACFGLALYLAGRFSQRPGGPAGPDGGVGHDSDDQPDGTADRVAADRRGWSWRRRDHAPEFDGDHPAPADLTVAPAAPFARPEQRNER